MNPIIPRRHFLRASGMTLALPWFESLAATPAGSGDKVPPKRFCSMYFPYGVALPKADAADAEWSWWPHETGKGYTFTKPLSPLEPFRDKMTILSGLSHPLVRGIGGHDSGDTFLTGTRLSADTGFKNGMSLDQYAARTHGLGDDTRFSSLVLSSDGGVGMPTRANTLSYTANGQPIPSLNRPATVFERLFATTSESIDAQRRGFTRTGSHLDLLMGEAKSLSSKLGRNDQAKLEQYLESVRDVEQDVERAAAWLDVPRPKVNAEGLSLEADQDAPADLIRTMLDLIVLAFQTDSTRFATYQLGSMHGAISIATKFPLLLDMAGSSHSLAHNAKKNAANKGAWDSFLAGQLSYFLKKLDALPEGDGTTLLDNTLVYYGSSNSTTHNNNNYPLLLAGGSSMGYAHGQHLNFSKDVPLANLYLTMLQRMGAKADSFADSNGLLPGI